MSETVAKQIGLFIDWATKPVVDAYIREMLTGEPVNEDAVLQEIADKIGVEKSELTAALTEKAET